ncbi:hypothetical protein [Photobacterium sp. OFAV2-7]|uniref:hypothetical protein n=1 Tax=Photobacterium sp. OFAV2-7 TaxID=2917748 RepID=UPI001EF527BE|nr:hypothetical protein [Photobacterium sp. OFAV2-7]MCG7587288.1 hypothetical protein [Photobacterium sp. OFAV2-7]
MSVEIKNTASSNTHLTGHTIESMSDIFILRPNGKIAYLTYDFYTDKSRVIESVPVEGEIQRFFLEQDGTYPFNLSGPTVTKVIDWNLYDSNSEQRPDIKNTGNLPETGYFLDLRRITLNRLDMLLPSGEGEAEADQPVTHDLSLIQNGHHLVPKDKLYQLKVIPEQDNLYIAFYQHPEKTRTINNIYSYCVSYISASDLDECEFVADAPLCQTHSEAEIKEATEHLESYYGDAQVQSGALNLDDFYTDNEENRTDGLLALACYIANLRTFKSNAER